MQRTKSCCWTDSGFGNSLIITFGIVKMMQRYFLHLAYNGANYHGWQVQPNAHTVQAEINEKLSLILGQNTNIVGCGRTDTGVHARDFYAHFESEKQISNTQDLTYKLNSFLPADIVIFDVYKVKSDMHARFSAKSRTYRYYVNQVRDPFKMGMSYYYHGRLDVEKMNTAAGIIMKYDDFTSFSKLHTQTDTNICKISTCFWKKKGTQLVFTIKADRFLRNMVRAIVGTLIEIGKGKLETDEIKTIVEAADRSKAGFSVPAGGLFLEKVEY